MVEYGVEDGSEITVALDMKCSGGGTDAKKVKGGRGLKSKWFMKVARSQSHFVEKKSIKFQLRLAHGSLIDIEVDQGTTLGWLKKGLSNRKDLGGDPQYFMIEGMRLVSNIACLLELCHCSSGRQEYYSSRRYQKGICCRLGMYLRQSERGLFFLIGLEICSFHLWFLNRFTSCRRLSTEPSYSFAISLNWCCATEHNCDGMAYVLLSQALSIIQRKRRSR